VISRTERGSPLYLDDIRVGWRFVSEAITLDERQIINFADQFDPQSFHIDPQAASETLFGGLIASGWHTAALTMRLLVDAFPIAGGTIGLGVEVTWPQPTRPGDILHLEGEVVGIAPSRSKPDRAVVTIRVETKNQRGDTAQILIARLLVFRRHKEPG
jgi:acyl dehydratase